MNDNINLNALWAKQICIEPNQEDLLVQVKKIKQSNLRKLVIANCLLLSTAIFIILVWIYFQPQFITTKVGIVLIILAMAIYLVAYNKSFLLFNKNLDSDNNRDYINDLLAIKAKQAFMHTTMLNLYFILLSLGIGLYMYEYTSRMKPIWGLVTYGITFLWILFNWFYLRPKQINKQRAKLDTIISKFEMVNNQLNS
jgi:membrane protein YdbS with pleckstrin-like domain